MPDSRSLSHAARLPAAGHIVALLFLALATVLADAGAQSTAADPAVEIDALVAQGDEYVRARDWKAAVEIYERVLEQDPTHGVAWNQLGYCRLYMDDRAGAAVAFERAAENGFGATAYYNLACVRSLDGQVDEAVDWLEKSLKAGFFNPELVETDPDLENVRNHPRFSEIYTPVVYAPHPDARAIQFPAVDGMLVDAELYLADGADAIDPDRPLILLFHQAGSNSAEYQPIAPRLVEMGFQCMALDARGGGRAYGRNNETVERWRAKTGNPGGGNEALVDFEGAVRYARQRGYTGKMVVWGSSYSAGRLFELVARHPGEFAAAVSYSPGRGWMRPTDSGGPALATQMTIPIYMMWPPEEFNEGLRAGLDAIPHDDKVVFVPEIGRHGSSTLRPDRNPDGAEENWASITLFLEQHAL